MVDGELKDYWRIVMDVGQLLSGLKKTSKKDDIPGTVEQYLEEVCPACHGTLKIMKPCCGEPRRVKQCACGYKVYLEP